jgi:hypothetical protein
VLLELTLDVSGRVVGAEALAGDGKFREAALEAAKTWVFEPATRNGSAIPVRIRYLVEFTPPEPEPTPEPSEAPSAPAPATKPRRAAPLVTPAVEVEVRGQRAPIGAVTIKSEDVRSLPGSFGDPLRSIEAQPGVVPIVSGLPVFFIRGAPPANVGFFFDGVDLPLLYHAFFGPSVLHPGFVSGLEFYPGAAPATLGRFAGPTIVVGARPLGDKPAAEGSLRVIDAGGIVESGPIGGCRDSATNECSSAGARAAGRYSYAGLVLSLLSDAQLDYWDYQLMGEAPLGKRDKVGVLAFGGYDLFRPPQTSVNNGAEISFHRVDARWDHRLGPGSSVRLALTGGYDRSAGAGTESSLIGDQSLRIRSELVRRLSEHAVLKAGADSRVDRFVLETSSRRLDYPDYSTLFPSRVDNVSGAYIAFELEPAPGVRVAPGFRADVYSSQGISKIGLDPRVSASFAVSRKLKLEHSLGIAHQRPNFAAQVPGAQVGDLKDGLQWALLASSGFQLELPLAMSLSTSVFRSAYFHALDPLGGARDFTIDRTVLDRRSTVSAVGLELRLARSLTERLGGFISYTLSRSEQSSGNQKVPSGFDRTHVLQGALSYDLGKSFRVGARTVFYSGIPELNLEGSPHFLSARRGTPFFRVDFRAEKRFRIGTHGYWGVIGEILNATATREVVRLDCGEICRERVAGPVILPSVGIEAGL